MKVRVLIVEDDPITCQDLKEILTERKFDVVGTAASYERALGLFNSESPDLLLVDVKLKGEKDGIDLVKTIHETSSSSPPTIFLTANSDQNTKKKAFETNPAVFLTKPFNEQDLLISLELAFNNHQNELKSQEDDQILFIKTSDHYARIREQEILYIKAEGSYCKVVTEQQEFVLSCNLNTCAKKLSDKRFVRIHRSYMVNWEKVTAVRQNDVSIGLHKFPIGRSYKQLITDMMRKIS